MWYGSAECGISSLMHSAPMPLMDGVFAPLNFDDLCRTGWQYVGPKIANPNLDPETIDTFEIGSDWKVLNNLKMAASAFYSKGNDPGSGLSMELYNPSRVFFGTLTYRF